MTDAQPQFLTVGNGEKARKIAYLREEGGAQTTFGSEMGVMWLLGLNSDMVSTKATALAEWARAHKFSMTRFEYSAHGQSEGAFAEATIGDWLEESEAVFRQATKGSQLLVGSSTGGYLALLLLRRLLETDPETARRVRGLVLIAPATDLTEDLMWQKFSKDEQDEIMEKGVYMRPSNYGDPYMITKKFIEEGRNHLFGGKPFDPGCPVTILQGVQDVDVPVEHVRAFAKTLPESQVELIVVADGEHRMSRPQDLELLYSAVEKLARG